MLCEAEGKLKDGLCPLQESFSFARNKRGIPGACALQTGVPVMKLMTPILAATTALTAPLAANAAEITLDTQLTNYGGEKAYLAYYITDADGNFVRHLWIASGKSRWWDHLRNWYAATGGSSSEIAGLSGASVGSGKTLEVTVDVEDALINAGYQIRVDSSVEHMADMPAEVSIPLDDSAAGQAVSGRGFIATFSFDM
jgi:hypothetical protein